MKLVFFTLWFISFIVWCIYAIRNLIEVKKDGDYLEYCTKMDIALIFMLIFNVLLLIFK